MRGDHGSIILKYLFEISEVPTYVVLAVDVSFSGNQW